MATSLHARKGQLATLRGPRFSLPLLLLSSATLVCASTSASAQDVPEMGPTTPVSSVTGQGADTPVPVGTVRQPTVADPGVVTGVTLGELYTDNLQLAAPDKPQQSSWITEVAPFIKAATNGPRFSGLLDYKLTGYLYAGQSGYNQLSQDFKGQGTLTLLPDHLFVDGTALYGSEVINNQSVTSPGTYFLSNNRANVARGTISPYWIQDLGRVGMMSLRYSYGRVIYNTRGISGSNTNTLSGIPDVSSNGVQFDLVSPKYETWGWNLHYSDQHIEPDYGQGIDFAAARAGTSLQINPSTRLLADGGKESKFLPDGTVDKFGASFWDAGFSWANSLNQVKLLVGHRFFGRSYRFSWIRTAALLTTVVSYTERPTDINQQLLGQNPGELIGSPLNTPSLPSLAERQPYLMKRGTLSATYQMPTGSLRLTLYDERRSYFTLSDSREKVDGAHADWLLNIGPFTTLTSMVGWQRYRFRDGQVQRRTFEQVALAHQFDPSNFATLKLRHDSANVSSVLPSAHGYGVNVVFLEWTHLF